MDQLSHAGRTDARVALLLRKPGPIPIYGEDERLGYIDYGLMF